MRLQLYRVKGLVVPLRPSPSLDSPALPQQALHFIVVSEGQSRYTGNAFLVDIILVCEKQLDHRDVSCFRRNSETCTTVIICSINVHTARKKEFHYVYISIPTASCSAELPYLSE